MFVSSTKDFEILNTGHCEEGEMAMTVILLSLLQRSQRLCFEGANVVNIFICRI